MRTSAEIACAFVDAAVGRHVRVAVDDPRRHVLAGTIDDNRVAGHAEVLAHGKNLAVSDDHRRLLRSSAGNLGHEVRKGDLYCRR